MKKHRFLPVFLALLTLLAVSLLLASCAGAKPADPASDEPSAEPTAMTEETAAPTDEVTTKRTPLPVVPRVTTATDAPEPTTPGPEPATPGPEPTTPGPEPSTPGPEPATPGPSTPEPEPQTALEGIGEEVPWGE